MPVPIGAALLAGGSILSGLLGSSGAKKAAAAQERLGREALALQERQFQQSRTDLEPWRLAGGETLGMLVAGLRDGSLLRGPDPAAFRADPGYQFRVNEAMRGINSRAAAAGNLLSGGRLAALAERIGNEADQTYNDWWTRERTQAGDRYNRLAGVAGTGQTAATNLGQLGQGYAHAGADILGGIGRARAAGINGQTDALQGILGSLMSLQQSGYFKGLGF